MDESKPAPPRHPSRTLVIALVAVLIVVAIAGIVLAGLRGRPAGAGAVAALPSATQQPGAAPTTAAPEIAAEAGAGPSQLAFASDTDTLSPMSLKKIVDTANSATKGSHTVVISAKLESGGERERRMELAKKRADAVRRALQSAGMPVSALKVQISELPPGLVPKPDADRLELTMK